MFPRWLSGTYLKVAHTRHGMPSLKYVFDIYRKNQTLDRKKLTEKESKTFAAWRCSKRDFIAFMPKTVCNFQFVPVFHNNNLSLMHSERPNCMPVRSF